MVLIDSIWFANTTPHCLLSTAAKAKPTTGANSGTHIPTPDRVRWRNDKVTKWKEGKRKPGVVPTRTRPCLRSVGRPLTGLAHPWAQQVSVPSRSPRPWDSDHSTHGGWPGPLTLRLLTVANRVREAGLEEGWWPITSRTELNLAFSE